ncbi:hemin uptake protein HemP [Beggiatoa alba]|nr:hemin uptake protein HemP [Beggiatoa alba]
MSSKITQSSTTVLPVTTDTADAGKFDSHELFQGRQEICIEHADQLYRLRITRQGKLILTK